MAAKHRMPESLEQAPTPTDRGRRLSGVAKVCEIACAALLCAACLTALVLNGVRADKRTVVADVSPPTVSQPVKQEGTVIAVTVDSVTMRSADGYIQTYRFTPDTTVITHRGSQPAVAAPQFTVNDRVVVVGTIEGGSALATAVAYRGAGHGEAPPMDFPEGQPVPVGAA
ncbi:hypothetical protein A5626_03005 [Mycobacterium marseillense]|uniref:DUF5666 domain-containing protein n=1 Tax=Mycobacterium marseillense TaxID=701042 RepID=A0AAC9YJI1_9MYCO|nr:hypothetical protein [Mycobacterium marseillense]ASW88554.1 hypothetical protein CKJ54_00615 [Mycobacterium marseillense]OBJ71810.1 hypothetical protein A5626_03005 [Mycobacterium marseillense]